MATTSPHQLFLLADHLKLSLLERQRALALNPSTPSTQDPHISRSLTTLEEGLQTLESTSPSSLSDPNSDLSRLKRQFQDLSSQFNNTSSSPSPTTTKSRETSSSNNASRVRFRDDPSAPTTPFYTDTPPDAQEEANRTALFSSTTQQPYSDTPPPDQSHLDNVQIHAHHTQVLSEQDEQLDVLGQSISRQRILGMQMGEEMDEQNEMLDDVERGVDRHTGTLERARKRLGNVARKGKENWSWVTIGILVVILVILIAVLK